MLFDFKTGVRNAHEGLRKQRAQQSLWQGDLPPLVNGQAIKTLLGKHRQDSLDIDGKRPFWHWTGQEKAQE